MANSAGDVTNAVFSIFEAQHHQSHQYPQKSKFGEWDGKLASAIYDNTIDLYLAADTTGKYTRQYEQIARSRARAVAEELNTTTEKWLSEGKDEDDIGGKDRAARIGQNEVKAAIGQAQTIATSNSKKRRRWVTNPNCCKLCLKFNGKVRRSGASFGVMNGRQVYGIEDSHINCLCVLVRV